PTLLRPNIEAWGGLMSFLNSNSTAASALSMLGGDLGGNPTLYLFKAIVESRSAAEEVGHDSVVRGYFLRRDTSLKGMIDALNGSVSGEALRYGMLTVSVRLGTPRFPSARQLDSTKRMAAYLANKFVDALDRFNRDRLMTSAKNSRIFVEQEYHQKMSDLDSAYGRLEQFQETHGAISLPEQLTATVSAAAKLTGDMERAEMERDVEAKELGPNSPRIKMLTAEVEAAQQELNKYDSGGAGEYVLALKNAPELSRELAGYLREIKVLEQVTAFLREQVEQERISEQRDLPSLQLLDAALPPVKAASPNRLIFAIVGIVLGLLGAIVLTIVQRFYRDLRERPEAHYRMINILSALRHGPSAEFLRPVPIQTSGGLQTPETEPFEKPSRIHS